ncbi:NAD-dependent succinate-semialdehyde dehydrogenase [Gordonia aquimaris]|uniref:NAD-dependent succinate-semialdehyde dehydrogenase n=1 Tax=Gordonia aquimaris TaxID=2984863 RepID=A0A9X3D6V0_9ACTN|nr:NAD-dependent succinate-semialdehyde dehydrogenase [Gordonia aquimaris]MCX2965935.1 NAD-dependent succinate-semialdehyde dehydrogenase [Gordonia aquimaris]
MTTSTFTTVDPTTLEPIGSYPTHTAAQIDEILEQAADAAATWRYEPFAARTAVLHRIADLIDDRSAELAALITAEMGKPLAEAAAEVAKCAWNCRYVADHGPIALAATPLSGPDDANVRIEYEPLGVILAIMPWNFPLWQLFRFAAPAIMAGNTVILKHSPNVTGCALAIESIFAEGFGDLRLLSTILVEESIVGAVSDRVIADARVAAVTVTGSTRAGAAVASSAGSALKKSVLELGGSDPFIVLDDADLGTAAIHAVRSRFMCAGQTCIAAKRLIVAESVIADFTHEFLNRVDRITVGDPTEPATDMGPLARPDLVDQIERQVDTSVAMGATVLAGGHRLARTGNFYAPTVLADVTPEMPVYNEETFGPVAALVSASDDDSAVKTANDTEYGLAASIWSRDIDRAVRVGRRIDCGAFYVNSLVASDPRVPFGGVKRSGFGRELGDLGMREFTNTRTVWVSGTTA